MKKMMIAFTALLGGLVVSAQSDQNLESRTVPAFTGIKVSNGIELVLKQDASESVAVSASSIEYRSKIKTEVENGVLKIYYDNGKAWKALDKNKKNLKAYVSVTTLNALFGNSGAELTLEGVIKVNSLEMDFTSGSSATGRIEGTDLKATVNSGASARISGVVEKITVKSSSGAHFFGYDLVTQNCDASVNSGAKIEITVNKELAAKASSGGTVFYKGSCSVKNVIINSGGSIKNKS